LYAYARHTSIFEKMENRGRKREFEKTVFHMECPSIIALNGGKKQRQKSHAWAPLKGQ